MEKSEILKWIVQSFMLLSILFIYVLCAITNVNYVNLSGKLMYVI